MVYVEKGKFITGSDRFGEPGRFKSSDINSFCIDKFLVTVQDYQKFVEATGYQISKQLREDFDLKKLSNHPITRINYTDAERYAQWMGKRIPNKWEWEKSARGTDGREFPWGDNFDSNLCNTKESKRSSTTPVNLFPNGVSPYGCWDMAGNVWEWTVTLEGKDKIFQLHGGSYMDYEYHARCAYRTDRTDQTLDKTIGFRCVISTK